MSFAALLCRRLSLTADYPDIADTKCNDATDLERTYWNPELFFPMRDIRVLYDQ